MAISQGPASRVSRRDRRVLIASSPGAVFGVHDFCIAGSASANTSLRA